MKKKTEVQWKICQVTLAYHIPYWKHIHFWTDDGSYKSVIKLLEWILRWMLMYVPNIMTIKQLLSLKTCIHLVVVPEEKSGRHQNNKVYQLGTTAVCIKWHSNPSNSWDIRVRAALFKWLRKHTLLHPTQEASLLSISVNRWRSDGSVLHHFTEIWANCAACRRPQRTQRARDRQHSCSKRTSSARGSINSYSSIWKVLLSQAVMGSLFITRVSVCMWCA